MTGGGVLCGALVAHLVLYLTVQSEDHVVETVCTAIAAYGSFLLADSLQTSGVFATLTAGLIMGNRGNSERNADGGGEVLQSFWEFAAFVANSIVFLLIGMHESSRQLLLVWLPSLTAAALVTAGRAAAIYPLCSLFSCSSLRVSRAHEHLLFWGGLRGALALALVLGLPENVPRREEIITVSFAVVACSIFVQGLTIGPLLRAFGEIPKWGDKGRPKT